MKYPALIIALLAPSLHPVIAADKNPPLLPPGIYGRLVVRMPSPVTPDNSGWTARFCKLLGLKGTPKAEPAIGGASKNQIDVTTVAGNPSRWGKVNGVQGISLLFDPHTLVIGPNGTVYFTEHWNHCIRMISTAGYVTRSFAEDLMNATGLCIDSRGNLFVTRFYHGDVIRITPGGKRTIVQSGFNRPCAVCVDRNGNMWVANTYSAQIIRITPTGRRTVWKGMQAHHIALGPNDDLYVACQTDQTIRRIGAQDSPAGPVAIIAGKPSLTGPRDEKANQVRFTSLSGIAVSASGTIFVGDYDEIKRISPEGEVSIIAGDSKDQDIVDGPAQKARFSGLAGLAIDRKGNLWAANRDKVIRLVINAENGVPKKKIGTIH